MLIQSKYGISKSKIHTLLVISQMWLETVCPPPVFVVGTHSTAGTCQSVREQSFSTVKSLKETSEGTQRSQSTVPRIVHRYKKGKQAQLSSKGECHDKFYTT